MIDKRSFAVLGLGIFGTTVSKKLSELGHEVIVIDDNMELVQNLENEVESAIQGNITDIRVLKEAGVKDCDVAIIATGTHLEESLLCVLNLKELGVPYIVAKAKGNQQEQILLKMGVNKVVRPEKEMGLQLAKLLSNQNIIDMKDIDEINSLIEVDVFKSWIGKSLFELDVRNKYGLNVLGIKHENGFLDLTPSPKHIFKEKEHLLFVANEEILNKIKKLK